MTTTRVFYNYKSKSVGADSKSFIAETNNLFIFNPSRQHLPSSLCSKGLKAQNEDKSDFYNVNPNSGSGPV